MYFLLSIFKDMFLPLDRTHYQKSISGFKISLPWKQWHTEERRYRFLGVTLSAPAIFFRDNLGWYLGFRWFYFSIFLGSSSLAHIPFTYSFCTPLSTAVSIYILASEFIYSLLLVPILLSLESNIQRYPSSPTSSCSHQFRRSLTADPLSKPRCIHA